MKNTSFIYGIRPVLEALDAGKTLDKVWIQEGQVAGQLKEILTKLHDRKIIWKQVPQEKLHSLTKGANHQGIVVALSAIDFAQVEDVVAEAFEKGMDPLILVLDGVTDVRNFGAIARTAACAGVHAIVVPETGSAAINSDAVKTSAGALLKIPVCRTKSLYHTIKNLKNSGLKIAGASEKGATSIYECDFDGPLAMVMGNEETGISPDTWKLCDLHFNIPMSPYGVGSLNVSVATGIALFEANRRKLGQNS
ncbi:MAG: 23S rRNA (guanosine(2251)-2'-O)-methyltransferase RlmB [Bacteroidetes bacterium]|nr:23S rRNA (guanosine(2251)-2'-O)-methyltransferase RlmB [Bacteroidota bacterium]